MMQRLIKFFKKYQLSIFSGVLIGFSYIPFSPWAVLFCYAPLLLFIAQNNLSYKETFIAGWLTQFILTLIGFHWIAYTAYEFGHFPWSISFLALILFCVFFHIYIPLALVISLGLKKLCRLGPVSFIFVMALALSFMERIWPSIFAWNMGYSLLWAKWPIYQWADTIGFLGLSTLLFIFNALIAVSLQMQSKKKWEPAIFAILIFLVLNISGHFHKKPWDATDAELNFLAIQANIGNAEKIAAEKGQGFQGTIIQKFLDESKKNLMAFPEADILIWPETAIPEYLDINLRGRFFTNMLENGLLQIKKPLITGSYSKEVKIANRDRSVFNALFLLDEQGRPLSQPYRKTHLLAFGEYLPFTDTFPILLKWLDFIANFGRGDGPMLMTWNKSLDHFIHFGGQICYEGLYPEFSRSLSQQGAHILVNVTNDSWFGKSAEPYQHMIMTFGRAIETRRPLMRATNTGITSAIMANGEMLDQSPIHQEWAGIFKVKYQKSPSQSFYVLYGHLDWIIWLIFLMVLLIRGRKHVRITKS